MVIELLKFKVPPQHREEYIQKDAEIWTAALAKHSGFLGKEVWIDPHNSSQLILVIHWATKDAWQAVPAQELDAIAQKFDQALEFKYDLLESSEYQVRKFPS